MEKLTKTSNIINKILSVLFVLVIIAGLLTTILTAYTAYATSHPLDPNQNISLISLNVGNWELFLRDDFMPENFYIVHTYALVLTILSTLFSCYLIILLKRIFSPMAQGLPFDSVVSASLKKLAWSVLIFGFVYTVLQAAMETTYFYTFDLANLLIGEHIKAVELNVVADGSFIIGFVILLLLSHVFRYGEQLQQLSDETL